MKTNQIAVKHTKKQLLSNRKNSIDLTTWEWRMEEEANLDVLLAGADFLSQHLWEEH